MNQDRAGKLYWDRIWEKKASLPKGLNPHERGLTNYVNRKFHEFFSHIFTSANTKGKYLLEIGCARSAMLPYFSKVFGFKVYGIDYSEIGCKQAREILSNEGVEGKVICANFFLAPIELIEKFDVVYSGGVLEHFEDTELVLKAFLRFLKPGGLLITNIPNMVGLNGKLQKIGDRSVFEAHIPIDRDMLISAHRRCDLEIISCDYCLFVDFGVVNIDNWTNKFIHFIVTYLRSYTSKTIWAVESLMPIFKPNRLTSPYLNCVARKKCD